MVILGAKLASRGVTVLKARDASASRLFWPASRDGTGREELSVVLRFDDMRCDDANTSADIACVDPEVAVRGHRAVVDGVVIRAD